MTEFEIAQIAVELLKFYKKGKGNDYLNAADMYKFLYVEMKKFHNMSSSQQGERLSVEELFVDSNENEIKEKLCMSLKDLKLLPKTFNCLRSHNINTIGDLYNLSYDVRWINNFGKKSFEDVSEKMINIGLRINQKVKPLTADEFRKKLMNKTQLI